MNQLLKVLIVEDNEDDALLITSELRRGGYTAEWKQVSHAQAMRKALDTGPWDLVISDFNLPNFSALAALQLYHEYKLDIPFIVISGMIKEETAVELMKAGAHDYLMKDNLARLVPAVQRELAEAQVRIAHRQAVEALHDSEERMRTIVEISPDAIIIADETEHIIEVNPAACNQLGYTRQQLLTKHIYDIVNPEQMEKTMQIASASDAGTGFHESRHIRADGSEVPVELYVRRFSHSGRPAMLGIARDITERKKAEAEMAQYYRESEALRDFAVDLSTLPRNEKIETFVAKRLKEVTGAYLAGIGFYNPVNKSLHLGSLIAESDIINQVNNLLGKKIHELSYPVSDTSYTQIVSQIFKSTDSLTEITFGVIPPRINRAIKKITGIETIYALAFVDQNELFGTAILVFQKDHSPVSERFLKTIAHTVAVSIRKKKMEETLLESEHRFREMANLLPQFVFETDDAGRLVFANQKLLDSFGINQENLRSGFLIENLICEAQRPLLREVMRKIGHGMQTRGNEYTAQRQDGSTFPILSYSSPIVINNRFAGIRGVAIDITERRQAEDALRASEEKFRSSIENLSEGFSLIDETGHIIEWNPACETLSGLKREEAIGKPYWEVQFSLLPPERRTPERLEFIKSLTLEALRTGHSPNIGKALEAESVTLDGNKKFTEQLLFFIKTANGYRIGSTIRDTTRQKQYQVSMERFNARMQILHTIDRAILEADTPKNIALSALCGIQEVVPYIQASIVLIDPNSSVTMTLAQTGKLENQECLAYSDREEMQRLLDQPFIKNENLDHSSHYSNICRHCINLGVNSMLSIPLLDKGKLIGVLNLCGQGTNVYTDEHVEIAREVGDQLAISIQQARLLELTQKALSREERLNQITYTLSSSLNLDSIIPAFLPAAAELVGAEGAILRLFVPGEQNLDFPPHYFFPDPPKFRINSRQHVPEMARLRQPLMVNGSENFPEPYTELARWGFQSCLLIPILAGDDYLGLLLLHNQTPGLYFSSRDLDIATAVARQAGLAIRNAQSLQKAQAAAQEVTQAYDATIRGWSEALELRDKETRGHSERVMQIALALAKKAGMNEEDLVHFHRGVLLHDIGKMGIPDSILLKPGPLSDDEWVIMRQHPIYAYNMLSNIPYLKPALEVPYCHHERWDGSGYPQGLKATAIPLGARIFSVVDVWDALSSERPYHPPWPQEEVKKYIANNAGTQFDPDIVRLFFEIINALPSHG